MSYSVTTAIIYTNSLLLNNSVFDELFELWLN